MQSVPCLRRGPMWIVLVIGGSKPRRSLHVVTFASIGRGLCFAVVIVDSIATGNRGLAERSSPARAETPPSGQGGSAARPMLGRAVERNPRPLRPRAAPRLQAIMKT